jgi:hypothetical protein
MNPEQIVDLILHRHLPNGGWLDYWVKNAEAIGEYVRAKKLKPVGAATVPSLVGELPSGAGAGAKAVSSAVRIKDPGIRGGLRVPHLHFDGNVFMLNEQQWAEFSGNIIAESKAKLGKVNSVNFDQAMILAQTTESLS